MINYITTNLTVDVLYKVLKNVQDNLAVCLVWKLWPVLAASKRKQTAGKTNGWRSL